LVRKFLELGSIVVCIDNNQKELNRLRDDMSKVVLDSKKVHYYLLDLTSHEDIKSVCDKIRNEIGPVNILINNAGIVNHGKLFLDLSQTEVTRLFQVNVLAHFWLCQEWLPSMLEKNHGHIVNVASVCGLQGAYKLTDYCSSKFAAVGFTESLRLELANINPNNNIVVSLVCPFHVQTKLFDGVEFAHLKWLGLSMSAEEVASCIVNGVLANKECIYLPRIPTTVIMAIKK
jgi:all-trans-retinol dehydrogenase (NAD+)